MGNMNNAFHFSGNLPSIEYYSIYDKDREIHIVRGISQITASTHIKPSILIFILV